VRFTGGGTGLKKGWSSFSGKAEEREEKELADPEEP
jgi:hypothetical protein